MATIFQKTQCLTENETHFCPGCTHGVIHRIICEIIEELGIQGDTIGVVPVGCSVISYKYFNFDTQQAAHGRAPAVATGIKRALPNKVVFTYQGDGDLASIGTAEAIHAGVRGEKITTILVNNAIYGMTGGQMSPTTLPNQKTTTSQSGRDTSVAGLPIRMAEIMATLDGATFVERVSVHSPVAIRNAKKVLKQAFENQINGTGFSFVEVLSNCPTNWGISPVDSLKWIEEKLIPYYPLGNKKEVK